MNRGFALLIGATLVLLAACSTTDAPVALNDNGGLAPSSIAVVATEQQKLTASDSAAGSRFGSPVAIDGDTAIISSFQTRSAYIFTSDGTAWTEQAKLTTVLSGGYDYFGVSVALDGDTAIVGARQDGEEGFLAGAAYVFTRDGTTWTEQAKLTASNASPWAQFGASVAIDGDTAIIGANRGVADDGSTSGSAYVFTRVGTTWTEHARITASDAAPADNFGYSVAMDGDTAIIGAISDDDGAPSSGSAYVFTNDGATWTEQAKLAATDPFSLDLFGNTVAIDGDTAIIGSYNVRDDRSGSAYIFTRDGTTWTEQAKLTASDAATEDYFGWSVSIDGHAAIIGAAYDDDDGEFS